MANNRQMIRDHNQVISGRHNHTNKIESWPNKIQAFSTNVPDLGNKPGVLLSCSCGSATWLGVDRLNV
jgi:hypothetical protein